MMKIALIANDRSGILHTTIAPANRSEQTRFGLLDGVVIAFFVVLCVTGLALLLRQ
jgi:hypothetical protein